MSRYLALVGCENDKKRFEPGDSVSSKDFPAAVIKHWLTKGVLAEVVGDLEPEEDVDGDG